MKNSKEVSAALAVAHAAALSNLATAKGEAEQFNRMHTNIFREAAEILSPIAPGRTQRKYTAQMLNGLAAQLRGDITRSRRKVLQAEKLALKPSRLTDRERIVLCQLSAWLASDAEEMPRNLRRNAWGVLSVKTISNLCIAPYER